MEMSLAQDEKYYKFHASFLVLSVNYDSSSKDKNLDCPIGLVKIVPYLERYFDLEALHQHISNTN